MLALVNRVILTSTALDVAPSRILSLRGFVAGSSRMKTSLKGSSFVALEVQTGAGIVTLIVLETALLYTAAEAEGKYCKATNFRLEAESVTKLLSNAG